VVRQLPDGQQGATAGFCMQTQVCWRSVIFLDLLSHESFALE
jgi:hypothetical protein